MDIEEYLQVFGDLPEVVLDNEIIWPCPPEIKF